MPGIVGILTKLPREQVEPQLREMVDRLSHENFYATGTWVDETLGVYVGWVVRESPVSPKMPLRNERGDVVLVFSGEEYSSAGMSHSSDGRGDDQETSYLTDSYESDRSFPARLNGRFHGLVTDRSRRTATLFNDRWGMHRIYYSESRDAFYFAAEAKAILAVRPQLRRPQLQSLGDLIACGCVLDNRTLFDGIHVLPPASAWVFRGRLIDRKTYFLPKEWEEQTPLEPESFYRELRDVFSHSLPRYFAGEGQVGMSLTGGLDTRIIMAWDRSAPGALPCYSFGGTFRNCQDVILARKVAQMCGQPHEVIEVGAAFLSRFAHYAERSIYLTDGCTGVAHAADLFANEKAREIAPVRMTGNYGGEILRQVRAFKPVEPLTGLYSRELDRYLGQARSSYAALLHCHPVSFAAFKQAPWHHYGLLALEQTQLSLRSPFLDNDFVRTVFRAPGLARVNNEVSLRLITDGNPALMRIRTDRGLAGVHGPLVSALSRRFLNLTAKAEYAYGDGMPQWVAQVDHLLTPLKVHRLFVGRHKFTHFRLWYREVLAEYIREMLLDSGALSRPYLNRHRVERVVRDHIKGNRNYTTAIHQLLTLELVHRLFFDAR